MHLGVLLEVGLLLRQTQRWRLLSLGYWSPGMLVRVVCGSAVRRNCNTGIPTTNRLQRQRRQYPLHKVLKQRVLQYV